jgi:branched-chain amino acid transport system permease protein
MPTDIKKFLIYSAFLAVLLLPMVGFQSTGIAGARAFGVWGVFVGILALFLIVKNIRARLAARHRLDPKYVPLSERLNVLLGRVPAKIYLVALGLFLLYFPQMTNNYMIDVAIACLVYIMLGLGLNIVVGLAGLLDLGYIAFYAVGAYTYSLLNIHFGIGFFTALPVGVALGALMGCIIGYPTLRMRGDYLAIVTMGFGEIIRIVLNNWDSLTEGPNGLMGMAKPTVWYPVFSHGGLAWGALTIKTLPGLYYIILVFAVLTVIGVRRLDNSRIGRAWVAVREDEVAAELSGVPTTWVKLLAYALGAAFASMAGAFFAAKLSYTNPSFFILMESCVVLSIVVLGGMGSIPGIVLAGILLIAIPEVFRQLQYYRMFAFGLAMTVMMVLKPEGLVPARRRKRELQLGAERAGEKSSGSSEIGVETNREISLNIE